MRTVRLCAKTPHGFIQYQCMTIFADTRRINEYCDQEYFNELCKVGCPNFGKKWSCPPFAPNYLDYTYKYEKILIVVLQMELNQLSYIKQNYLKVKAANSVLKSRVDKALRSSMKESEYYISTGSCRFCKPCKCKIGKSCAHPLEKTYSFEALGINVSALSKELFDVELQWYRKDFLPEYTCVVAGLLTNMDNPENVFIESLKVLS